MKPAAPAHSLEDLIDEWVEIKPPTCIGDIIGDTVGIVAGIAVAPLAVALGVTWGMTFGVAAVWFVGNLIAFPKKL